MMQEAEEQDTCRICSAPAEPDQPLFHPCKCSGTIRYIHQDCLTTWLAHSKKKTCDVCKHPYTFTKVYAMDMPSRLPTLLLLQRLIQQGFWAILFALRATFVVGVWLGFLPWVTAWTWRMYFYMGHSTALWVSDRPETLEEPAYPSLLYHSLRTSTATNPPPPTNAGPLTRLFAHPIWLALSNDIFMGQIITTLIVIVFVAIFLLREWISQNARPGIFDDEVVPDDVPAIPAPAQIPQPVVAMDNADAERRPEHPPHETVEERELRRRAQQERVQDVDAEHPADAPEQLRFTPRRRRPIDAARLRNAQQRRRMLRGNSATEGSKLNLAASLPMNSSHAQSPRESPSQNLRFGMEIARPETPFPAVRLDPPNSNIPFSIQKTEQETASSSSRTVAPLPPRSRSVDAAGTSTWPADRQLATTPFSFSFPLPSQTGDAGPSAIDTAPRPFATENENSKPFGGLIRPSALFNEMQQREKKRPSLPTATKQPFSIDDPLTPGATSSSPFGIWPSSSSSPLPSPSLATYHAPEELAQSSLMRQEMEAGPSTNRFEEGRSIITAAYFQGVEGLEQIDDVGDEMAKYFVFGGGEGDAEDKDKEEEQFDLSNDEDEEARDDDAQGGGSGTRDAGTGKGKGKAWENYRESPDPLLSDSDTESTHRGRRSTPLPAPAPAPASTSTPPMNTAPTTLKSDSEEDDDDDEYTGDYDEYENTDQEEDNNHHHRHHHGHDNPEPADNANVPIINANLPANNVIPQQLIFEEDDDDEDDLWDDIDENDGLPVQGGAQAEANRNVADINRNNVPNGAQGGDGRQVDAPGPLEIEELENNGDDDMEGAMEAIGFRGPVHGVIQNATLMIFVLDTAIGLGVWLPYTIGKSAALVILNPARMLQIMHLPIRAIRILTDPFVDSILFLLMQVVFPAVARIVLRVSRWTITGALFVIAKGFGTNVTGKYVGDFTAMHLRAQHWIEQLSAENLAPTTPKTAAPGATSLPALPAAFDRFLALAVRYGEPHFAALGQEVRLATKEALGHWERIALGHGPLERVFAIALGYTIVALGLAIYLNMLTVGNMRNAGKAVRSAVRQQLLVIKVATFIVIELITFPLGCGIVLDACTVWLFPEANLATRTAFFFQAPLTAMFYHWLAGTMFMYAFAIMLSGCRSVMRPGAMWFIKDPQDQNAHPIRDILDRPTLTQLRKIFVSGVMYAIVVACFVGSIAGLLVVGNRSIMPLRWKNREPLSDVPVDLLFLIFVLPYTTHYLRPRKPIKRLASKIWKYLAARFRLSSYFFGQREYQEEHTPKTWSLRRLVFGAQGTTVIDPENDVAGDGSFRRVPAKDNIALPREMRATAAVTELGVPIDDEARHLMAQQNAEAEKAKRNVAEDYTIVYIPPHFRYRMIAFIISLWVIGAMHLGLLIGVPILLGRGMFAMFLSYHVHDGYSFLLGFYILWGCYLAGRAMDRLDKRRQRQSGDGPRANLAMLVLKRGLLWVARITYMVLFLGVIIPTLLAVVVDLYIVLPLRFVLEPDLEPRIRMVDAWALGLLFMKIGYQAMTLQPAQRRDPLTTGIKRLTDNGWTHPDPVTATQEVIVPIVGGLIGMVVLPALALRLVQYFMPFLPIDNKFIFVHVYPGIFALAGVIRSAVVSFGMLVKWSHAVRDKEFLVEMRLKNHEPEKPKPQATKKPRARRNTLV